jgi:tRNA(Ile)-lysidine synthase
MVPDDATILCAVSGGADSMALLHGLCGVVDAFSSRWSLAVAHFDHRLRAESGGDARFVADAASALGLAFFEDAADVRELARRRRLTVEEAARRCRYEFLARAARQARAGFVAMGHHADDQAETVLHRIVRGTALRGLAGIPPTRPIERGSDILVVRPLLPFRRRQLRAYLQATGRAYRDDVTNRSTDGSTRNRIRREILPLLARDMNPDVAAALVRLSHQARRAGEALRAVAEKTLDSQAVDQAEGCVVLSAGALADLPIGLRHEIIHAALQRLGVGMKAVTAERIEAAARLCIEPGRPRTVELPDGAAVHRRGDELRIESARGRSARRDREPAADEAVTPR